jgi:hypothetical protein
MLQCHLDVTHQLSLFRLNDRRLRPPHRHPSGTRIIWLPKRFGHFSIEILEEKALGAFIVAAFASK